MGNNINETEKIILGKIKENIDDNRELSFEIAKVQINNILKDDLELKEMIDSCKVNKYEE